MDKANKDLLDEFARGAELIFDNAEQMYQEACILHGHGKLSRALALHQLSNEECGKLDMLSAACSMLVMGESLNLPELEKRFSNHKSKNYANAYYSLVTIEERAAQDRGDTATSRAIFEKQQATLHRAFNQNKNTAIYVDFREGKFSAPKDAVTSDDVDKMRAINEYFLRTMHPHVQLIRRVCNDPAGYDELMTTFATKVVELQAQNPSDPYGVLRTVLEDMRGPAEARLKKSMAREAEAAGKRTEPGTDQDPPAQ